MRLWGRVAPAVYGAVLPIDWPAQAVGQRDLHLLLHPGGRLFQVPTAPARSSMGDPMRLSGHGCPARTCVVAQHPGQWAGGRPSQIPTRFGVGVIGDAQQGPARLHQGSGRVPCPVEPVRVEQWCSLRRGQRQQHRIKLRGMALTAGLHLPAERALAQGIDGEGHAHGHPVQQMATQRRHVGRRHVQHGAAVERQTAGRQPGLPPGQPMWLQGTVYKGLKSRLAGREAQGTVVKPRCRGMPLAIDPVDLAGGQATARPSGLVEHMDRVPGERQCMRRSGPGNAGADHRNRLTFASHAVRECMTFAIHTEFM